MKKVTEQPLTKLANAAFRQAARKVIQRAEESGTPVIVWEEGRVQERTAEEMGRAISRKSRRTKVSGPKR